jgi:hypothetical protein
MGNQAYKYLVQGFTFIPFTPGLYRFVNPSLPSPYLVYYPSNI